MNLKSIVATCTGLTLAFAVTACGGGERETDSPAAVYDEPGFATPLPEERTVQSPSVSVADIVENPTQFDGRIVTIEADVQEVLGPYAFVLDESALFQGGIDNDLIVLSPQSAQLADLDDQWLNNKVRVTGRVERMDALEVERELGRTLDPQIEAELESAQVVLIAQQVERM